MANKRSNGEGALRRKANGHWEIQLMVGYKPDGRRDIRSFSGKTQKEAKEKRDAFLQKRKDGLLTGEDFSFSQWADIWFEHHSDNIRPTTQESYSNTLGVLKAHFGRRKLADIKTYDIEIFMKALRHQGRSDSFMTKSRGMLYQIFNKAVANDLILKNPVAFAEKMRRRPQKRKEVFSADDVRRLMKELPENKVGWSIRLMLSTGMRVPRSCWDWSPGT